MVHPPHSADPGSHLPPALGSACTEDDLDRARLEAQSLRPLVCMVWTHPLPSPAGEGPVDADEAAR